jgi:peptidoglycan lytic transglycosylase D
MRTYLKFSLISMAGIALVISLMIMTAGVAQDVDNPLFFNERYHITNPPFPDNLTFAGEKVPLSDWNVRERLERELLVNTYWQSSTMLMLKRTKRFFPEIEKILKKKGIPDDFKYLALAESGLTNQTSSSGAKGIWQFMNSTADAYGLMVNSEVDERLNFPKSTLAACIYLSKAKSIVGSWTMSAAAYNRGLNGIQRDIKSQKVKSYYDLYLNTETSRYVFRILALKLIAESPEMYGFKLNSGDYYLPVPSYDAEIDTSITDLVDFAIKHGTTYRNLKLLNPWLRDDHLTIRNEVVYRIRLPELLAHAEDE